MSGPETGGVPHAAGTPAGSPVVGSPAVGAGLASLAADIVEIAAFRGRVPELVALGAARGLELPPLGRITLTSNRLVLCVRPERWLLLTPRASTGASAALWQGACAPIATAVDLSSGLAAFYLTGSEARAVLSRSCRLDLDPQVFPAGGAAATLMAQVSVLLAALPAGWLLLTPSSTARHVREWFAATARPFGFQLREDATVAVLSGESS